MNFFKLFFLVVALFVSSGVSAQDTAFIQSGTEVALFGKDTIAVFGSVLNNAALDLRKDCYLIMLGQRWTQTRNNLTFDAPDSSYNSVIEFRQPFQKAAQPATQWLDAGSSSASFFGSLVINNDNGLTLDADAAIANNIIFQAGHLFLNNHTLTLGTETHPGNLSGYTEEKFFVTDPQKNNGFLSQRSLAPGKTYLFPIGERPTPTFYHPVTVSSTNTGEETAFSVYNGAWSQATGGASMADSSVNTTWELKRTSRANNIYQISLQHNMEDEGSLFRLYKNRSYIGMYEYNHWSNASTQPSAPYMPGTLTTGVPIPTAATNSTAHAVTASDHLYFTKFANAENTAALQLVIPNVFTPNGDGQHDSFRILNIDAFPDNEISIVNRWGNEVFKTRHYSSSNEFTGRGLSEGTYYYQLRININGYSQPVIYKGYLTLIR